MEAQRTPSARCCYARRVGVMGERLRIRTFVVVATLAAACGPRAKATAGDGEEAWTLEPARSADVTAWIDLAQTNAEHTGDAEGQRALAALARRAPTNASIAFAGCVIATDGGDGRLPQAVDPESPCDNPDISRGAIRCCRAPTPALESCGYCDEAAREDSTLSEIARRYERRCTAQNRRREAAFERDAAHAWIAWARAQPRRARRGSVGARARAQGDGRRDRSRRNGRRIAETRDHGSRTRRPRDRRAERQPIASACRRSSSSSSGYSRNRSARAG